MWSWRASGPLEVQRDGEFVSVSGRPRRLLAALIASRGVALDPATIAERVWDEPSTGWASAVRVTVNRLRASLGSGAPIVTSAAGYQLPTALGSVDLWEFERLVDIDSRSAPERIVPQLEAALATWRGTPFQEFRDLPWVAPVASHLEELHRQAVERWAQASLDVGRHEEIVAALESAVVEEPYRERRWSQLMVALYRCGRQTEALRTFAVARRTLIDEMGVEPGRDLVELQTRILDQDPSLDVDLHPPTVVRARRPSITPIGRDHEQAHVAALLERHRCVVVLGIGGIGKTRLAHGVVSQLEAEHVLVELSPVTEAGQLASALASALGFNGDGDPALLLARAAAEIDRRQAVVLFDPCEHLASAFPRFAEALLVASRRVRILVTSRVPLVITGSAEFVLGPLELGTSRRPGPAALIVADHAGFSHREIATRWPMIQQAAQIAGGVPLALELAGRAIGRGSSATTDDSGTAQQVDPVAAAVELALDALPSGLVAQLRRLAGLPAGFTVAFAGRVLACDEREVRYHLDGLAHRGLVRVDHDTAPTRTSFLDPVRESLLAGGGPNPSQFPSLLTVVETLARDAIGCWREPYDRSLVGLLDDEHRNVQTILATPALGAHQIGTIATSLVLAWRHCGRVVEARALAEGALSANAGTADARLWAELLLTRVLSSTSFAERLVHFDDLTAARAATVALGDRDLELRVMVELAQALGWNGEFVAADAMLIELAGELTDDAHPWTASAVRRMRAVLTGVSGDVEAGVRQLLLEAEAFGAGYPDYAVSTLFLAANLLRIAGDDVGARTVLLRAGDHELDRFSAASHAKVALELARLSVASGAPDAEFRLRRAAVLSDQVGDTRSTLVCRRDLGRWLCDNGDRGEGVRSLCDVVPPLLVVDRLAAGVALAVLAQDGACSDPHRSVLALAAAQLLAEGSGSPLSPDERCRIERLGMRPTGRGVDDRQIAGVVASIAGRESEAFTPDRRRA